MNSLFSLVVNLSSNKRAMGVLHTQHNQAESGINVPEGPWCWKMQVMAPLEHFWGGRGATGCDSSIKNPSVVLLWAPQIEGIPPESSRDEQRGMGPRVPDPGGNRGAENRPLQLPPFSPGAVYHHSSLMRAASPGWGHRGRPRSAGRAAGMDSGSDTFPDRNVRRRRRRRRRAAAVAERSRPAQLLSRGGTHGLVTFDIFYTIF